MINKTGLWALGLFTLAGAITISCGGSSNSDEGTDTPKAGSSSSAGSGTGGSGSNAAGTTSGAGTNNGSSGSGTNGGTNNGGTNASDGGDDGGPDFPGAGGDFNFPGAGGDGNFGVPACPADPAGKTCTRTQGQGAQNSCLSGTTFCTCRRQGQGQDAMSTWQCFGGDNGAGGDNGGPGGTVTCPANAMSGQDCTGLGQCAGQQGCYCFQGNVFCQ